MIQWEAHCVHTYVRTSVRQIVTDVLWCEHNKEWGINGFMQAEGKRCGGVHNKGDKNDKGLEMWEVRKIQQIVDSTECGLVWGVWFVRVAGEGVVSLW